MIGYDHRCLGSLSSESFARMTAAVFISQGFKVYLLTELCPTPFVAFGVTNLGCAAGVMVTASHNPKQDDGYKVYWNNGSQIIAPHDMGIAAAIKANLAPWQEYNTSMEAIMSSPLVKSSITEVQRDYLAALARLRQNSDEMNANTPVRAVYTAMHGVGHKWVDAAVASFNLPTLLPVTAQVQPDPTFPTVPFPNPEEKGALNMAQKFADDNKVAFVVANDPDADRLAMTEKISPTEWYNFSGNEIGVLLGQWQIERWVKAGGQGEAAVLASVVSSRMLKAIAKAEGVQYHDTLTGFKWLGDKNLALRKEGVNVLFSYEEALGYCVGDVVCDKDGVSAISVVLEMASQLCAAEGATSYEQLIGLMRRRLLFLYGKYGQFVSYNSYVICHDPVKTDAIFHRIRTGGAEGGIFQEVAGVKVVAIKDITNGYDSTTADKSSALPATPGSHMIMFDFDNGVSVTLRTSGTEPKIKFYTEIAGQPGQGFAELDSKLRNFVEQLVEEMLQPNANGLIRA